MTKRILIIDDSEVAIQLMTFGLQRRGYKNLITSQTGQAGLDIVESAEPDLAVVDIVLPDMSGFDICNLIKNYMGERIKVILITGDIDMVDAGRARRMGANHFVVKTSNYGELVDSVESLMDDESKPVEFFF